MLICTHNRPASLGRALTALLPQVKAGGHELIVVNDGTPSAAYDAVLAPCGGAVDYLVLPTNGGIAAARNHAAARATGDYLVFTDDDTVAPPFWLNWLMGRLAENPALDAVAGWTRALAPDTANAVGKVQIATGLLPAPHPTADAEWVFVTACLAVRRSLFDSLGGFRLAPQLRLAGEDTELSVRLWRQGARILMDDAWFVEHELGTRLGVELRRQFRYGQSAGAFAGALTATRSSRYFQALRPRDLPGIVWRAGRRGRAAGLSFVQAVMAGALRAAFALGVIAGRRHRVRA